jgi:hypothetical protein
MCDFITSGRQEPCKDSVGGISAVYFVKYDNIDTIGYVGGGGADDQVIDDVASSIGNIPVAYKYDVRNNSSYTENIQASRESGTNYFEQVLELTLIKLTKEDHKAIKALSVGRPHIVIEDNLGNLMMAGLEHGCDVTGGTVVTGGAMGDMSGYTLSFTGMERFPANFLDKGSDTDIQTIFTAIGFDTINDGSGS